MKPPLRDNIYAEGSIIYAKDKPGQQLIIRRYVNRIYFCKAVENPSQKDLIYFEKEITDQASIPTERNMPPVISS